MFGPCSVPRGHISGRYGTAGILLSRARRQAAAMVAAIDKIASPAHERLTAPSVSR